MGGNYTDGIKNNLGNLSPENFGRKGPWAIFHTLHLTTFRGCTGVLGVNYFTAPYLLSQEKEAIVLCYRQIKLIEMGEMQIIKVPVSWR